MNPHSETQDADTEDARAILSARDLLFSLPASFLLSQAGILLGKALLTMDKPLSGAPAQNTRWQAKPRSVHQRSSWGRLSTSHDGTAAAQDKPLLGRSPGTVERDSETQDADTEDARAILLARDSPNSACT